MLKSSTLLMLLVILTALAYSTIRVPDIIELTQGYIGPKQTKTSFLFVGDVMLARHVETVMKENGHNYPFIGLTQLKERYDHIIGNFEAPIAQNHRQTENFSYQFSVATSSLTKLSNYFTAFSLANNHTFDLGEADYKFTEKMLVENSVIPFGNPNSLSEASVQYYEYDSEKIAVLAVNAVAEVDYATLETLLNELENTSVMQIVYVHWGQEYQMQHSNEQETLAHFLIDNGADTVIGHHPHVVQNIDVYKGALVFYSLGNFIFDQYFSDSVQTGLGVELLISNNELSYRLVPFTSLHTKSSPRLMTVDEEEKFLAELALRSSPLIAEKIQSGSPITTFEALASL